MLNIHNALNFLRKNNNAQVISVLLSNHRVDANMSHPLFQTI